MIGIRIRAVMDLRLLIITSQKLIIVASPLRIILYRAMRAREADVNPCAGESPANRS
jgi:hypothetical protein